MSYEYNPASSRFEIANPHRVENAFLIAAAAVSACFALVALLEARAALASALSGRALIPILVAAVLLAVGLAFGVSAMRQLRFFFGRNQPKGLATELPKDAEGLPADSRELRDTLRQNAIKYEIPTGALDNLLYSLARDLVFSPPRTQRLARSAFHNSLVLAFLLLCFAWSVVGTHTDAVRDWLGALYLAIAVYVLRPVRIDGQNGATLTQGLVVGLVILGVLAPVLLPYAVGGTRLPLAAEFRTQLLLFVVLFAGLLANGLLLFAVLAQQVKPNQIAMAQSLQTLSMNAPPNQIFLEFDRVMQRGWTEQIPNRIYLRALPRTDGPAGAFEGNAIEETQPVPQDSEPLTLGRCLRLREYRGLVLLDLLALALAVAGGFILLRFADEPLHYWEPALGAALLFIAYSSFAHGNLIWRRFEFTSRIYWLEMQGNFQRARSSIGAVLTDRVKTEKELVSVEDMTLRVWVAELDSVCFGPDTQRSLMSIRGLPSEAEHLSGYLANFAKGQASVVAPQGAADLQRLATMQQVNTAGPSGSAAAFLASIPGLGDDAPRGAGSAQFCSACGTKAASGAQFCAHCGTRLGAPPADDPPASASN